MSKLLFDLEATQPQKSVKRHGGGKYGEVILFKLIESGSLFSCYYNSQLWLNPTVKRACLENGIELIDGAQRSIQDVIDQRQFKRVFSCIGDRLIGVRGCELFGTIHDARVLETPSDSVFLSYKYNIRTLAGWLFRRYFKSLTTRIKQKHYHQLFSNRKFHLITVSEHSKNALQIYFPELRNRDVRVFYSPNTSLEQLATQKNDDKFFLLVNGNRWGKNNLRAIKAFDRLISAGMIKNVKVKITAAEEYDFKYAIKNRKAFDFLGFVDDNELEKLYADAYALVYPSLHEGFGYPPIEAMRYGVPVISSSFASLAEICGEGALYFNPLSTEEIMNRILMINSPVWYKEYTEKSLRQYKRIKAKQDRDLALLVKYITE